MKIATEKGIVNTEKAIAEFNLDKWNGHNTESEQGLNETLFKSKKDVWYILHTSQWQGAESYIEFVYEDDAWKKLVNSDCDADEYEKYFPNVFVVEAHEKEI